MKYASKVFSLRIETVRKYQRFTLYLIDKTLFFCYTFMFEYFPLPCFHHPPGDFLMPLIRYFSIEIARTATTVTLAPAAEIVMVFGGSKFHIATLIDRTQAETLRLCHMIDVAS